MELFNTHAHKIHSPPAALTFARRIKQSHPQHNLWHAANSNYRIPNCDSGLCTCRRESVSLSGSSHSPLRIHSCTRTGARVGSPAPNTLIAARLCCGHNSRSHRPYHLDIRRHYIAHANRRQNHSHSFPRHARGHLWRGGDIRHLRNRYRSPHP